MIERSSNVSQNQLANESGEFPIYGASGLIKHVSFYHNARPYISIVKDGPGVGRITKVDAFSSVIGTLQYIFPKDGIDLNYLYYSLLSVDFKKFVTGAAIPHIYFKDYKNEPFLLAPLPEQHRIVAILDRCFTAIDRAKTIASTNLQNARELFESSLNGVFEKGGKDWEVKKFGELFEVRDGNHDSPKYQSEGYPLITSKNLKNDSISFDDVKYISERDFLNINKRSKVDKNDVLFAMIGTIGNPVVVDVETNFAIKNVALFKSSENQDSHFLQFLLQSQMVKKRFSLDAKGTTQKFLGLGYLRNFSVCIPPLKEQRHIVSQLDALQKETKRLEEHYTQKLHELEELKKAVLQKAFSGELVTDTIELPS